jgi:hypothetical protein
MRRSRASSSAPGPPPCAARRLVPAAFAVVALGWTSIIVGLGATTPIVIVVIAFGVLTIGLASAVVPSMAIFVR